MIEREHHSEDVHKSLKKKLDEINVDQYLATSTTNIALRTPHSSVSQKHVFDRVSSSKSVDLERLGSIIEGNSTSPKAQSCSREMSEGELGFTGRRNKVLNQDETM